MDRYLELARPCAFITATNEHVEESIRLLDAMMDTEMQADLYYGPQNPTEGTGWVYDEENGKINTVTVSALSAQMSVHSIHRVYHAVVYGNLKEDEGFVEKWLGRDPRDRKKMAVLAENAAGAKYAYTGWQVLERCGNFTYIACKLKTGRTHQIRVHMASTGHPLAGDAVYGPKNCIKSLNGQCLHAKELGFVHPRTGEWMQFDSPLPPYFTEFLTRLRKEHRA